MAKLFVCKLFLVLFGAFSGIFASCTGRTALPVPDSSCCLGNPISLWGFACSVRGLDHPSLQLCIVLLSNRSLPAGRAPLPSSLFWYF
jgi:hypothetical protein